MSPGMAEATGPLQPPPGGRLYPAASATVDFLHLGDGGCVNAAELSHSCCLSGEQLN